MRRTLPALAMIVLLAAVLPTQADPGPEPWDAVCVRNFGGTYDLDTSRLPTTPGAIVALSPVRRHIDTGYNGVEEFVGSPGVTYDSSSPFGWQFEGLCADLKDILACLEQPLRCLPEEQAWAEAHGIVYDAQTWVRVYAPSPVVGDPVVRFVTTADFLAGRL